MIKHHIDLTLTEEQTSAMEGWLELLQQSMSMLVSVSGPDSRRLFKLGAKSEAFVRTTLEAAAEHEALLPGGIREHMERDAALRERLRPILVKLQNLLALVEGSYKLAGADLMKNGTAVYQILRLNGYQEGLEPLLEELGTRFARPSMKAPPPEVPAPAGMTVAQIHEAVSHPVAATSGTPFVRAPRSGYPATAEKKTPIANHRHPASPTRTLPAFSGRCFRPVQEGGRPQMPYTARRADLRQDSGISAPKYKERIHGH